MKVIILAGGLGTRISEYTKIQPNQWSKLKISNINPYYETLHGPWIQ